MNENEKGISQENSWGDNIVGFPGDLRDHFAGQALMSMLSPVQKLDSSTPTQAARWAYKFADAMMKERSNDNRH